MPRVTDTPQTNLADAAATNGRDPARDANGGPVSEETVLVSPVTTSEPQAPSRASPKTNGKRRASKPREPKPAAAVEAPKRKARRPKPAAEPTTTAESTPARQRRPADKKAVKQRKPVADQEATAEQEPAVEQQPVADPTPGAEPAEAEPSAKKRSPASKRGTVKRGASRSPARRKPTPADAEQPDSSVPIGEGDKDSAAEVATPPSGGARKSGPTRKKSPARPARPARQPTTAKRQPRSRTTPAPTSSKPEETPELSHDVWAAEAPPPLAAVPDQPAIGELDVALELCEIAWWRGYVKSEFYADAVGPEGDRYQAAKSPKFWWRRNESPPTTPAVRAALDALVEKLVKGGWEHDGCGYEWYQLRFRRRRHVSLISRYAGPVGPA